MVSNSRPLPDWNKPLLFLLIDFLKICNAPARKRKKEPHYTSRCTWVGFEITVGVVWQWSIFLEQRLPKKITPSVPSDFYESANI